VEHSRVSTRSYVKAAGPVGEQRFVTESTFVEEHMLLETSTLTLHFALADAAKSGLFVCTRGCWFSSSQKAGIHPSLSP